MEVKGALDSPQGFQGIQFLFVQLGLKCSDLILNLSQFLRVLSGLHDKISDPYDAEYQDY